jgi:hypothetical protein
MLYSSSKICGVDDHARPQSQWIIPAIVAGVFEDGTSEDDIPSVIDKM